MLLWLVSYCWLPGYSSLSLSIHLPVLYQRSYRAKGCENNIIYFLGPLLFIIPDYIDEKIITVLDRAITDEALSIVDKKHQQWRGYRDGMVEIIKFDEDTFVGILKNFNKNGTSLAKNSTYAIKRGILNWRSRT